MADGHDRPEDDAPEVTAALLLRAYRAGIFPMAHSRDDPEIFWMAPRLRGVLPLDGFHLSRSLRRTLRRGNWRASLNHDFTGVMRACADRPETWISDRIFALYRELHDWGYAHSLEIWQDDILAGGVYGVALGRAFFGESMFSARRDGSKVALAWLVAHLSACGFTLFDTQFLTDHLASLGGIEIPRAEYQRRLARALSGPADIRARPLPDAHSVVQRITQMSNRG